MTENFHHSSVCLRVYLASGRKALEHLKQGLVDDALADLRKRKASFHNFKVADFNLEKSGAWVGESQEIAELWAAILTQDQALHSALHTAMGELSGELNRLRTARKNLASFKSTHQSRSQFAKKV